MNKTLLLLLLFIQSATAQVISIAPDSGEYGQSLNTTITVSSGLLNMGSPPMQMGDVYLKKGTNVINATSFQLSPGPVYDDTINATFDIPLVTPPGRYDVHVLTGSYVPWWPYWQVNDNVLVNGFLIEPNAGVITGKVYMDVNQNGVQDSGDYGLSNIHVHITPGNSTVLTDTGGNYEFFCDTNTYTVFATLPFGYTATTPDTIFNITVPPDSAGNDFGTYFPVPNPAPQNFWLWTHPMRCMYIGFSNWYIENILPITETGSITVIHSPNLGFQYSSMTPDNISGDTITWNYTLGPGQLLSSSVNYNNPAAGDTVWYIVIDSVYYNSIFQGIYTESFQFVVSCSVDPNDKHASPVGDGPQHLTLKDSELTYVINFQNTGTDTAFNVHILDTLSSNLDFASLRLLSSSDPVYLTMEPNGALRFEFDNIMLPDSNVDEPGSHGNVIYRIKPMTGLADSTLIENTAYIYFDLNPPVVTNTAYNLMVQQLPVSVRAIQSDDMNLVYPNPVTQISRLMVPPGSYRLSIYDLSGREIVNKEILGSYLIDKSIFTEGVYYYRLTNNSNSHSGKFIVVK